MIRSEKRAPLQSEIRQIHGYNQKLAMQAEQLMDQAEGSQGHRKLTALERGRLVLKFLRMNESPDDFMLANRYLDRTPGYLKKLLAFGRDE